MPRDGRLSSLDDPEAVDTGSKASRAAVVPLDEDLHLVDVEHRSAAQDACPPLQELDSIPPTGDAFLVAG